VSLPLALIGVWKDWPGVIDVDLIGRIRRAFFEQHRAIKAISRDLQVSRGTVRKVLRSEKTAFNYAQEVQPLPANDQSGSHETVAQPNAICGARASPGCQRKYSSTKATILDRPSSKNDRRPLRSVTKSAAWWSRNPHPQWK
jgi:hypothetical protein